MILASLLSAVDWIGVWCVVLVVCLTIVDCARYRSRKRKHDDYDRYND